MSKTIHINNVHYEVFEFQYISGKYSGVDIFVLLEDLIAENKKHLIYTGEIYILVPSWVEMQDLRMCSCKMNLMTREYEVDNDAIEYNKIFKFCTKIVDHNGEPFMMTEDRADELYPSLARFIGEKIDEVIYKYYFGTGLSNEEEKKLSSACYKYYSTSNKVAQGVQGVTVAPAPGIVSLLNICELFNCTPDVARKISKKDIDSISIAYSQKNLCNNPSTIGYGRIGFGKKYFEDKKRR